MHSPLWMLLHRCCQALSTFLTCFVVVARVRPLEIDARRLQNRPQRLQNRPSEAPKSSQDRPRGSRSGPRASQERPRAPKSVPGAPQERPKSAPRAPQENPRSAPKALQGALGTPLEPWMPEKSVFQTRSVARLVRETPSVQFPVDFRRFWTPARRRRTS